MQHFVARFNLLRASARKTILSSWYGSQNVMNNTSTEEIEKVLGQTFPNAAMIQVEDKSGGCGAMFEVYVESEKFRNLTIPKQHKLVYAALKEQIKLIHGIRVITKVP